MLTTLLEDADSSTRIAAGEAIALIFETGRAYNFCIEEGDCEFVKDTVKTQASRYSSEAKQNEEKSVFDDIFVFLNVIYSHKKEFVLTITIYSYIYKLCGT